MLKSILKCQLTIAIAMDAIISGADIFPPIADIKHLKPKLHKKREM
jgi:hypothetical protein